MRTLMSKTSHTAFQKALKGHDFGLFQKRDGSPFGSVQRIIQAYVVASHKARCSAKDPMDFPEKCFKVKEQKDKGMVIEVTGVNTWNKGAELMLVAVKERYEKHHPGVSLAVDQWFGTYGERAKYGAVTDDKNSADGALQACTGCNVSLLSEELWSRYNRQI